MIMFPIILVLLVLLDTSTNISAQLNYTESDCYNDSSSTHSFYARNSPYETNLHKLLSTLVTNISTTTNGFFQHKQGSESDSEPAYGLVQCQGGLNPSECRACVALASNQVKTECRRARQAIMWKEKCMLRYSYSSFFNLLQTYPYQQMSNFNNITENKQAWVTFVKDTLLSKVVSTATSNDSANNYATNEEFFTPTKSLWYTMAQCTPDLTKANCTMCLNLGISVVQRTPLAQGGIALTPSCTLRYESYAFYETSSVAPPAINAAENRGKNDKSITKVVVAIIVPLAVVGMLIALGTHLYRKKAKKYPSPDVQNG